LIPIFLTLSGEINSLRPVQIKIGISGLSRSNSIAKEYDFVIYAAGSN
jgi:hypothetical protein